MPKAKDYLFWLGVGFIISPVILYWFIHGSYERYIWIINGPYPFSSMGSGPFQLFLYSILIFIGIILLLFGSKWMNILYKCLLFVFFIAAIILVLTSCYSPSIHNRISNSTQIKIPSNFKIEFKDTHGGFHGDGTTLAKVKLEGIGSENVLFEIKNKWNSLPLSENLNLIMYGGTKDNIEYMYNFAKELGITNIKNGYWYFVDRHTKSTDINNDENLLDRNSFNFTLVMYDSDKKLMYYLELDT